MREQFDEQSTISDLSIDCEWARTMVRSEACRDAAVLLDGGVRSHSKCDSINSIAIFHKSLNKMHVQRLVCTKENLISHEKKKEQQTNKQMESW